jgi:membrane protein YdbS with pleckstrin-like domain
MNALLRRLIIDATPPIEKMSARLFKLAALFIVTASLLFVSATFLAIGLFVFVQPFAGTAIAALVTGIIYLGAAGICIFVASRERSSEKPAAAESGPMAKTTSTSPPQRLGFAQNIDETVAPILDVLRESGLERERIAVAAGTEIAKQLHPLSVVAFAIVAGFFLGRILKQDNNTPG